MKNKLPNLEEETRKAQVYQITLITGFNFLIDQDEMDNFKKYQKNKWVILKDIKGRESAVQTKYIVVFHQITDN